MNFFNYFKNKKVVVAAVCVGAVAVFSGAAYFFHQRNVHQDETIIQPAAQESAQEQPAENVESAENPETLEQQEHVEESSQQPSQPAQEQPKVPEKKAEPKKQEEAAEPKKTETPQQQAPSPKLAASPPTQAPEQPKPSEPLSDYAAEVVRLCNTQREKVGAAALSSGNSKLQSAANLRATEIKQSFSHTRPNGTSFDTALAQFGISPMAWGENIAYGQQTPQQVVDAWMNSEGHRKNILNSSFNQIAVGVNGTHWVQLFVKM